MSTHVLTLQRYSSAAGVGLTVTFVLLFLMQSLVAIQPGASVEPRNRSLVDFVRVKKVEEVRAPDPERPDEALKKAEPVPPRIGNDPGDTLPIAIERLLGRTGRLFQAQAFALSTILAAATILIVVSLLTPPSDESVWKPFFADESEMEA